MTTAVLGAHGLIGSALVRHFSARTLARRAPADRIIEIPARLDFSGIETLIHAAGITDEDFADPAAAFAHAIAGTAAVVDSARASGVQHFCYLSSAHVYGPLRGTLDETAPPNPLSDYALAHFAAEQIVRRAASENFRVLILRPCAVFGVPPERFRRWSLVPFDLPRQAAENGAIVLRSHGLQLRNFVGTGDIARIVETWLARDAAPFERINPLGHTTATVRDFANLCAREYETLTGRSCPVTAPPGSETDAFAYCSRIDQTPSDDLAATIRALIARLLKRSARCD